MTNSSQLLLKKLESLIASNLSNEQFGVEYLANLVGISRSNLHRKLKKINGKSISRFIREYRLEEAKKILVEKDITTSEVFYRVGFGSLSYFSKCFKEYFGYPPSKVKAKILQSTNTQDRVFKIGESIMVLPFKNLSPTEENEYLAHGITEAIGRNLSSINDLSVISSSGATSLNSMKEIWEKYGVTTILQGSLQLQNHMLRIEIKLFNTCDGRQIWAQYYDRKVLDILQIQSDIAKNVVNTLKSSMSIEEQAILVKRTSYAPLAYDNYLKGMYHMNQIGDHGINESLIYFKKAIDIDSSIAPAYAAIANAYHMKASIFSASMDSKEAFEIAERYLDIAIKLDKNWHFNYTMKAFQLTFFHWNFKEADIYYKKGLKAKKPLNYIMYRDFLQFENRHQEALEISLKIDKETPFYPNAPMVMPYYYSGMYDKGVAYIQERLTSFSSQHLTYDNAGFFMLNSGNYDKAIELFRRLIEIKSKRYPRILGWMAAAHAHKGETEKAQELLAELKELKKITNAGSPKWFMAIVYAALGKNKEALKWLKIAVKDHEMEVPWLVSEPQFYVLHGIPDFDTLVRQVGFPDHAYPIKLPKTIL